MIFVAGTMTFDPAVLPAFRRDVAAMLARVRAEAGCRHYSLLVEDEAADVVNVHELWDDDASLEVHLKQPWIVEFFAKYVGHVRGSTLRIYDVAGDRPLPGR